VTPIVTAIGIFLLKSADDKNTSNRRAWAKLGKGGRYME
jgi:hypothetical protein